MRSLQDLEVCLNQLECLNDLELQKLQIELRRLREQIQQSCNAPDSGIRRPSGVVTPESGRRAQPRLEVF